MREERKCQGCKYFVSYEQEYEDSLEPYDLGICDYEKIEKDNWKNGYASEGSGYTGKYPHIGWDDTCIYGLDEKYQETREYKSYAEVLRNKDCMCKEII